MKRDRDYGYHTIVDDPTERRYYECNRCKNELVSVPLEMSQQIPDTPENIERAVLNTKPKKQGEWRFIKAQANTTEAD